MYHTNPAVIKNLLSQLPKQQFIVHARYIRRQAYTLPAGTRKFMFMRLYAWCQVFYRKKWQGK